MRDREVIDSESPAAGVRRVCREQGRQSTMGAVDALQDERRDVTGS